MAKNKSKKIKNKNADAKDTRKTPNSGYPEAQGKGKKIKGYPLKK